MNPGIAAGVDQVAPARSVVLALWVTLTTRARAPPTLRKRSCCQMATACVGSVGSTAICGSASLSGNTVGDEDRGGGSGLGSET